jgi:hypothetical protein
MAPGPHLAGPLAALPQSRLVAWLRCSVRYGHQRKAQQGLAPGEHIDPPSCTNETPKLQSLNEAPASPAPPKDCPRALEMGGIQPLAAALNRHGRRHGTAPLLGETKVLQPSHAAVSPFDFEPWLLRPRCPAVESCLLRSGNMAPGICHRHSSTH